MPFLYIKRQQKNTQAKVLEKIASWQHALLLTMASYKEMEWAKEEEETPLRVVLPKL